MQNTVAKADELLPELEFRTPKWRQNKPIARSLMPFIKSWERDEHWKMGPMIGTVQLEGDINVLGTVFKTWLGFDVREMDGTNWSGFIESMTLMHDGNEWWTGYEAIDTSVRASYKPYELDDFNVISNGSFEVAGSGVVFRDWEEYAPAGSSISQNSFVTQHDGNSCAIARTSSQALIGQSFQVEPNTNYRLAFYARGTGSNAGRYRIQDFTKDTDIKAEGSTGVTAATWTLVTYNFLTDSDTETINVQLLGPNSGSGTVYFDNIKLKKYNEVTAYTPYQEDDRCVELYGRKQITIPTEYHTEAEAIYACNEHLARHCAPRLIPVQVSTEPTKGMDSPAIMTMNIAGYMETAKWREGVASLAIASDVSDPDSMGNEAKGVDYADNRRVETASVKNLIKHVLNYGCDYLDVGSIADNTDTTTLPQGTPYEILDTLVNIKDSSDNIYRFTVTNGRVHYEINRGRVQATQTPNGIAPGSSYGQATTQTHWLIKPGVWKLRAGDGQLEAAVVPPATKRGEVIMTAVRLKSDGTIDPIPLELEGYADAPASYEKNESAKLYESSIAAIKDRRS